MTATTTAAPAGFLAPETTADEPNFFGDLHKGPTLGEVETSWTPEEGILVHVGAGEGMTVDKARQLLADLRDVLGRVEGL
ncbi:hypothetical protein AB4Y77_00105 [Paenarthrobacter sp. YAF11_1]|uniref:hypothetical protein n=1 Tax=Paenarthrobacter sp. YAF11_1 TaxID=3233074 RepID=UPI003F945C61